MFWYTGNLSVSTPSPKKEPTKGPLHFQVGANSTADQQIVLSIPCMNAKAIGVSKSNITTRAAAQRHMAVPLPAVGVHRQK